MVSIFLLYLSVKRATGLLVFLYYFVLPSLNKAITYLLTCIISRVISARALNIGGFFFAAEPRNGSKSPFSRKRVR